jgi:mannose-1-phosphate guanylyltransferase
MQDCNGQSQAERARAAQSMAREGFQPDTHTMLPGGCWALVLAGGEGTRLHSLTTTASGVSIPKQFCSLRGGASLLQQALKRAASVARPHHICAAVMSKQKNWWQPALRDLAASNIFVQPANCGTAAGILLRLKG